MNKGHYYIFESRFGNRLAFRCTCGFNCIFGDGQSSEVSCCKRTYSYEKPKPTLWTWLLGEDELPRVKPKAPPFVLSGRRQESDEGEFLQQ